MTFFPFSDLMQKVRSIFDVACNAALPHLRVKQAFRLESLGSVIVNECEQFTVDQNVYVAAIGKASLGMYRGVEDILGQHIVRGIVSTPCGSVETLKSNARLREMLPRGERCEIYEGALNNLPDAAAMNTAMKIKQMAKNLTRTDVLIVLISGGGSALLPLPPEGISLADKLITIQVLTSRGATIQELNIVRQQLSQLKNGGLARIAQPATVIALIFSDIVGNPIELIASGPTVLKSGYSAKDCQQVIKKFTTSKRQIPSSVMSRIEKNGKNKKGIVVRKSAIPEGYTELNVHNFLVGSNACALDAARDAAQSLGYDSVILSDSVTGVASDVAKSFAQISISCCRKLFPSSSCTTTTSDSSLLPAISSTSDSTLNDAIVTCANQFLANTSSKKLCLISGGETTVELNGSGKGGRNQELALSWAVEMMELLESPLYSGLRMDRCKLTFLSAGTDGQDGPTDAAGAILSGNCIQGFRERSDQARLALSNNDSYSFFNSFCGGRYLFKPGLTGTNVMDIQIILIELLDRF